MKSHQKFQKYSHKGTVLICMIAIAIIAFELSISFIHYVNQPLDGDIAGGVVPENEVEKIFHDPFGINVIYKNKPHPNPNRYFSHLFFRDYLRHCPVILQWFTNPVESVYLSCGLIKILSHLFLLFLLAKIICGRSPVRSSKFLAAVIIILPLFQSAGYADYMGLIHKSTTYLFFYTIPLILLLVYIYLFYTLIYKNNSHTISLKIIIGLLTVIIPFSGPLIPPVILLLSLGLMVYYLKKQFTLNKGSNIIRASLKSLPKNLLFILIPICVLSLYSLFLGLYNSTFPEGPIPLLERYSSLPKGIYDIFTKKLGFPLLFTLVGINLYLLKKSIKNEKANQLVKQFYWILIFSVLYVLLLPLGGSRPSRPNTLRFDTIAPVTVALIYFYGASTMFILYHYKSTYKHHYTAVIITFSVMFTIADLNLQPTNTCEKQALYELANTEEQVLELDPDCLVLTWEPIYNTSHNMLNIELLRRWNIIHKDKFYVNKKILNQSN